MDSRTLVTQMRDLGLWPDDQAMRQALLALPRQVPEGRELARELLQRNLLTPYQANQLLTGKGAGLAVGSYLILERLGEGGMGQVFKARHARLGRLVALKLVRPQHVKNPTAVGRFLREVEAAAQLSHPNIVRAYDAGEAAGTFYLAMEYVDGPDLARLVKRDGPLQVERACDYTAQAALGLEEIHRHGMVHRDIKPSNLMVGPPAPGNPGDGTGRWGQLKLLDLGLARLCENSPAEGKRPALTKLGVIMGTVDYMAPEQAIQSHEADARSDIYGLGCTFYLLLTGHAPFPTGDTMEKMLKHQLEPVPPVEQERPEVPPAVAAVLTRMLAKRPEERFQSAAEVADALLACLAPPSPTIYRGRSRESSGPGAEIPPGSRGLPAVETMTQQASEFAFDQTDDGAAPAVRASRPQAQPWEWWIWALVAGAAVGAVLVLTVMLRVLLH